MALWRVLTSEPAVGPPPGVPRLLRRRRVDRRPPYRVLAIGDVLTGVAIALGENELSACYPMDQDADGAVTVSELIAAVNHVLTGCPE
jgi:hypothetical protein